MRWYEFLLPTTALALLVRLEALFGTKYWALVELIPNDLEEDQSTRRSRRAALKRRMSLPFLMGGVCTLVMPDRYSPGAGFIIGIFGASLLLWPLLFHGLPIGVRVRDWELLVIYPVFVLAFGLSGFLGADTARWVKEQGGILQALRNNVYPAIALTVIVLFLTTIYDRVAHRLTVRRDERLEELEAGE